MRFHAPLQVPATPTRCRPLFDCCMTIFPAPYCSKPLVRLPSIAHPSPVHLLLPVITLADAWAFVPPSPSRNRAVPSSTGVAAAEERRRRRGSSIWRLPCGRGSGPIFGLLKILLQPTKPDYSILIVLITRYKKIFSTKCREPTFIRAVSRNFRLLPFFAFSLVIFYQLLEES